MELAKLYLRQLTWTGVCIVPIIDGLLPTALYLGSSQTAAPIATLTAMLQLLCWPPFPCVRYVLAMAEAALRALHANDDRLGRSNGKHCTMDSRSQLTGRG